MAFFKTSKTIKHFITVPFFQKIVLLSQECYSVHGKRIGDY